MPEERAAEIDRYIEDLFIGRDDALDAAVRDSADAGLPEIQVSPVLGKLLYLLAKTCGARRILEIGTLGGYSTIWLARALTADGELVTLEIDEKHAAVARRNIDRAGVGDRVDICVAPALESLGAMHEDPPFDFVFIDADKEGYPAYLDRVIPLTRAGGLIVADNIVRGGKVLDPAPDDASAQGSAAFNRALASDSRVESVVVQQTGSKGHDGIAIARVR